MALIKLTMVAPKAQISPLAIDQNRVVGDPMAGSLKGINLGELKESDMVAKPVYLHEAMILGFTTLNDPIPIAQAAVMTGCMGVIFVAEDCAEIARLIRVHGKD